MLAVHEHHSFRTHAALAQSIAHLEPSVAGLHQGKTEAYLLYFFIAHVYDNILNPWHWTPDMREASLSSGDFGLRSGLVVADVGAGTGSCPK